MANLGRRRAGLGNTVRLGLRLARAGGKVRMSLVIFGAFLGSVLILLALSFQNTVSAQNERAMAREAYHEPVEIPEDELEDELEGDHIVTYGPEMLPANPPDDSSTLYSYWWGGTGLGLTESATVLLLTGGGPVPPGIGHVPTPDQAFVSPALKSVLEEQPDVPEVIAGKELLEISDSGLRNPNELIAYIGVSQSEYPDDLSEQSPVVSWGIKWSDSTMVHVPGADLVFPVFAFLLAPAVILLATTTRLASSVRTERMAAFRLVGVSRRRTQLIAGIETGVLATLGVMLGLLALLPIAKLTEGVDVFGFSWFASDFRPTPVLMAATLAFVPALTVLTALVVLRKISQNPLQIRRKAANPKPS
ncbi:MAG TPA: ABC transporter permease, partial [Actinomycetales bacterium]|nr:ABC transporter permease [Actinomycetales bacterium]